MTINCHYHSLVHNRVSARDNQNRLALTVTVIQCNIINCSVFTLLYDDFSRVPVHWKHGIKYIATTNTENTLSNEISLYRMPETVTIRVHRTIGLTVTIGPLTPTLTLVRYPSDIVR